MITYTITPVNCGLLHGVDRGNLTLGRGQGEKVAVPTIMYVIQGNGETVIVDAGPGDPQDVMARFGRTIEQPDPPQSALRRMGIDPGAVRHVVATHLHFEHAGGLDLFPNATVYVQRSELAFAIAPLPLQNPMYEYHAGRTELPRWLSSLRRMQVLDGDLELLPGITLLHVPGHTPGMMAVAVRTEAGVYLAASDAVPVYANWDEAVLPGLYLDAQACYDSLRKLKAIADHVLPGHDERVFRQATYPAQERGRSD